MSTKGILSEFELQPIKTQDGDETIAVDRAEDVNDEDNDAILNARRHDSVPNLSLEETEVALNSVTKRKEKDRNQLLWIFIIPAMTCKGELREVTLRELLAMVTYEAAMVDKAAANRQAELEKAQKEKDRRCRVHFDASGPVASSENLRELSPAIAEQSLPVTMLQHDVDEADEHTTPDLGHCAESHVPNLSERNQSRPSAVPSTNTAPTASAPRSQPLRRRSMASISVAIDDIATLSLQPTSESASSNPPQPPPPQQSNGIDKGIMRRPSHILNPLLARTNDDHDASEINGIPSVPSGLVSPFSREDGTRADGSSAAIGLRIRDLRRLDFSVNPNVELSVQVRRHVVLLSVDPLRAIITSSKVILFVPPGGDTIMEILEKYMHEWLFERHTVDSNHIITSNSMSNPYAHHRRVLDESHAASIPFEIHAYESIMSTVQSLHHKEKMDIMKSTAESLAVFRKVALLSAPAQESMRAVKVKVSRFLTRISNYRRSLDAIIEDDEGTALMALSKLKHKPQLYSYPLQPEILSQHEEIEETLESFLQEYSSLETEFHDLKNQIQSAEEHVSLRLDISRNEALMANTVLAILACSLGFGAFVTGAFGMNLDQVIYLMPTWHGGFVIIVCVTTGAMVLIFMSIYWYFTVLGVFPQRQH